MLAMILQTLLSDLHSVSSRAVGVVFSPCKITGTVELELLFQWQCVEFAP